MKHLFKVLSLVIFLFAGSFILLNSCKSTGKTNRTTNSSGFADTASMRLTDTGKGTTNGKDVPPKP